MFDLNTAETGSVFSLIPDGTVARAVLTIRPGGAGEGGWLKASRSGALMIDAEWTITEGKFARRKLFDNMLVTGNEQAVSITKRALRALVEGHLGINPEDMSEAAQAARRITSVEALNGMEGCLLIGVEKAELGSGYEDKNRTKAILAPGESKYLAKGQLPAAAPGAAIQAPAYGAPAYGAAAAYQAPPAAAAYAPPPAAPAGAAVPAWG